LRDTLIRRFREQKRDEKTDEIRAEVIVELEEELRFDLAPEELAELQLGGVVFLVGKEIITRRNADGSTTTYYRDKPDEAVEDNLLSLPRYVPPYQPPP
jgi:hypothetical protein